MMLMVLGNREVIKHLFLTRLRKCQHVLKWCNLLRMFLQFVCLKERNVWTGCLWRMTSKHKPQPTYAGVSRIYDALKLADLFNTSSSLFISFFQWHSVHLVFFYFSFLYFPVIPFSMWICWHKSENRSRKHTQKKMKHPMMACRFSQTASISLSLTFVSNTACILSPFRSTNVTRLKWNICHFPTLWCATTKALRR